MTWAQEITYAWHCWHSCWHIVLVSVIPSSPGLPCHRCHCHIFMQMRTKDHSISDRGRKGWPPRFLKMEEEEIDFKVEAELVIKDIGFTVESIDISKKLPSSRQCVYLNVLTKERKSFCVELSVLGFRVSTNYLYFFNFQLLVSIKLTNLTLVIVTKLNGRSCNVKWTQPERRHCHGWAIPAGRRAKYLHSAWTNCKSYFSCLQMFKPSALKRMNNVKSSNILSLFLWKKKIELKRNCYQHS